MFAANAGKKAGEFYTPHEVSLLMSEYVDSSEAAESWDIYASMFGGIPKTEIAQLTAYWDAFPGLENALFADNGTPYCALAAADVETVVKENAGVAVWKRGCKKALSGFWKLLDAELIGKMLELNRDREESVLGTVLSNALQKSRLLASTVCFRFSMTDGRRLPYEDGRNMLR